VKRRSFFSFVVAAAISGGCIFLASSRPAAAQGVLGGIVDKIIPGAGTAMDAWSREYRERDSDASVGSQILGAKLPREPFRPAQGGQADPPSGDQLQVDIVRVDPSKTIGQVDPPQRSVMPTKMTGQVNPPQRKPLNFDHY